MSARRRWARASLALLALALAVLAGTPSAAAEVRGQISYDLVSLEEAEIDAELNLTGEEAASLRERADHDDDGGVGPLEAAGAKSVLEGRLEGPTDAYTLDGEPYANERVSVSEDGLQGPVDGTPFTLTVRIEAQGSAGSAPHAFAVHGLPGNLTEQARLTHVVHAPEGYAITGAERFATVEDCQARTEPIAGDASLTLHAEEEACQRSTPGPGPLVVLVGLGLLARATQART